MCIATDIPYNIAICDDEKLFLEDVFCKVKQILDANGIPFKADGFINPEKLIQKLKNAPDTYDIIFLDIMMKAYNGIEVAKTLRFMQVNAIIIFITVTKDFALEGYEVDALRYLLKPINMKSLCETLLICHKHLVLKKEQQLILRLGTKIQRVLYADIVYVQVKGRGTVLVTKVETIQTPYKITEISQKLQKSTFHRCHQSFIVNLPYINQMKRYEILLTNSNSIPVSKAYYQTIKSVFLTYLANT